MRTFLHRNRVTLRLSKIPFTGKIAFNEKGCVDAALLRRRQKPDREGGVKPVGFTYAAMLLAKPDLLNRVLVLSYWNRVVIASR